MILMPLYVDDSLCAHNNPPIFHHIISKLNRHFEMSYLGPAHFMLRIKITQDQKEGTVMLNQCQYITDMLDQYGMSNCHTCPTPMNPKLELTTEQSPQSDTKHTEVKSIPYQNVTGSLLYAAMATRPDIAFTVRVLCQFNSNYGTTHWTAAKQVMHYLKGTTDLSIIYHQDAEKSLEGTLSGIYDSEEIEGFTDADWAGDIETQKSTSGYIFTLTGGPVSWSSKTQTTPALSSTEAEYVSTTHAAQEAIYLCTLLSDIGFPPSSPTKLWCDNQSAISLTKSPIAHSQLKHIDIRHHFIQSTISEGHIKVKWIPTTDQVADILTKPLPWMTLNRLVSNLGMVPAFRPALQRMHPQPILVHNLSFTKHNTSALLLATEVCSPFCYT